MSRIAEVTLKLVVSDEGQGSIARIVTRAVHEALQRRRAAHFASGPGIATGLETFEDGVPVNLPSGGTAVVNWINRTYGDPLAN